MPQRAQLEFFGDAESEAAFARDLAAAEAIGARLVEFDFEPFAEVARLLYEGAWVAERYAATKPLIETEPEASIRSPARSSKAPASSTRSPPSKDSTGSPI